MDGLDSSSYNNNSPKNSCNCFLFCFVLEIGKSLAAEVWSGFMGNLEEITI